MESPKLNSTLSIFGNEPAIFNQKIPDDVQFAESNYPRIVFSLERFADAVRGVIGILNVEIQSSQTKPAPETIEPMVREMLEGVFFTPSEGTTFSVKWKNTTAAQELISEKQLLIDAGILIFDVYEYPSAETSTPDPVLAMNHWISHWDENLIRIGTDDLAEIFVPTKENPAIYFDIREISLVEQANTLVWHDATINTHLFAPSVNVRREWLQALYYSLSLAGEIPLLDGAEMYIRNLSINFQASENEGQLQMTARFTVPRQFGYAHPLLRKNMNFDIGQKKLRLIPLH